MTHCILNGISKHTVCFSGHFFTNVFQCMTKCIQWVIIVNKKNSSLLNFDKNHTIAQNQLAEGKKKTKAILSGSRS